MSSLFDPSMFLDTEVTGEMSVKVENIPVGRYNWQIEEIKITRVDSNEPGGKPFHTLELKCVADGQQKTPTGETVESVTGREKNYARFRGYFDLTEQGSIDLGKGRNVALGQVRAAVGLNNPGQPFRVNMLKGQVFSADVIHQPDKNNPDRVYVELRNPGPIGLGVTQ